MIHHSRSIFMARAMAWVIDFIILEFFHFLLFFLIAGKLLRAMPAEPHVILFLLGMYFYLFFAGFVLMHMSYFTLFHALTGQTLGKMILGIKVVGNDNKPTSPAVAFLRCCGYVLSFIPLATGFLWAAVDRDQRAWHDWLAQTRVIPAEIT